MGSILGSDFFACNGENTVDYAMTVRLQVITIFVSLLQQK
jgi:hypothetical protein